MGNFAISALIANLQASLLMRSWVLPSPCPTIFPIFYLCSDICPFPLVRWKPTFSAKLMGTLGSAYWFFLLLVGLSPLSPPPA